MSQTPDSLKIQTARLALTIPTPEDARRMLDYVQDNREHLAAWEPSRQAEYYALEFWIERLGLIAEEFKSGRSLWLMLADRNDESGRYLGMIHFSQIVRGPFQAAYLGYSLDHRAVGKGLMYEALTAAIKYVFEEMKLHRIMANYMPGNERSGRLLKRLGFIVEGYARDYLMLAGKWEDHILTAMVNESWDGQ
ncbi:MAG TPA: ribosomal protein S5-alanine N-acetyltransferase [Blastocatellia bacterium]|jgi:ribosomal-protein-alanine N-acetyltransferase